MRLMGRWRVWRCGPADAAELARLERLSFSVQRWAENNFEENFVAPRVTALFAGETENLALGFALWRDLGGEAELLTLGVPPAARRKGLGAALLAAAIDGARAAGAKTMFLEVATGNAAALALYRARGFEKIGARRAYYRDGADALVMQLKLANDF